MKGKIVAERYGVKMVDLGKNAAVYVNGKKIFEGEFFKAGRVYTLKEKEAAKLQPKQQYRTVKTATADWKDILGYAMSMHDAGFHRFPDTEKGKKALAERYRKTMIEIGETEISVPRRPPSRSAQ